MSVEERALVHPFYRQLHLPNRSVGSGQARFVLVARPRPAPR